ncbi:MAG: chromate transporter [Fischerella sp.]|jgi:chromate transport protein ChrA|uniref:chromate transporter n=1 Tax=Fischerella sp. TaxID=1191 RepID=UPI00179650F2|nr:chromate transporter [Fischerella sp.]NWF57864.1 chromate transporter [Fischerella sp.]
MSNASTKQVQQTNSPSLRVLVAFFAGIGARAFGGAIPTHVLPICLKQGWLTNSESLEALNWCRFLPGTGGTNISAYLGYYWRKTEGAILATLAVVLPGSVAILVGSKLLSQLPEQIVQASLTAVVAASIGILLELTWKLAKPTITDYIRFLVAIAAFILVGIFRVPIPLALVVVVPFAWHLNSKTQKK